MAGKKKSRKGKGQYATYKAESRLEKNRDARRKRHLKNHPNDEQSIDMARRTVRKASGKKGNYPAPKVYIYDGAGRKILMPSFVPQGR